MTRSTRIPRSRPATRAPLFTGTTGHDRAREAV